MSHKVRITTVNLILKANSFIMLIDAPVITQCDIVMIFLIAQKSTRYSCSIWETKAHRPVCDSYHHRNYPLLFSVTEQLYCYAKMVGSRIATTDSDPMVHTFPSSPSSSLSGISLNTSGYDSDDNRLRVFLIQTAKGLFSSSGGYKANLCFLRYLASRGHSVRQLCYPHRGEVDAYVQTVAQSGKRDPQHCTRRLHLRAEDGKAGTDIDVNYLVLNDGVQIVALDKEAFDEGFGGKNDILRTMPNETAAYIEVSSPAIFAMVVS